MKAYILGIVAAGIVSAVVGCLVNGKTPTGKIIRLLCGVLITTSVVAPLGQASFQNVSDFWNSVNLDASDYVAHGELAAKQEHDAIIKEASEAYILDKAARMGLDIAVEVELDDSKDSIPCKITVSGALSPYAKSVLSEYIAEQLGIPKESQRWI